MSGPRDDAADSLHQVHRWRGRGPGLTFPATTISVCIPPEWFERAGCAGTDAESFFPEKGNSARPAKRVCANCPVRAECLDYALAHHERWGVWGGLSERERRRLKGSAA